MNMHTLQYRVQFLKTFKCRNSPFDKEMWEVDSKLVDPQCRTL